MGLFDGLRGTLEKTEIKGDEALVAGDALRALSLYRDAFRKAQKKAPESVERLRKKTTDARKAFVRAKIDEAQRFLEDEVVEAAAESIEIARGYLEPSETTLVREIETLKTRVQQLADRLALPEGVDARGGELVQRDGSVVIPGTISGAAASAAAREGDVDPKDEAPDEGSPEILFEQLSAALPEQDREHGLRLGRAFQEGFVAQQRGEPEAALEALEKAAQEHPSEPLVIEYLARALDELGRTSEAEARYHEALETDPCRLHARMALASILAGIDALGGTRPAVHWMAAPEQNVHDAAGFTRALDLLDAGTHFDEERSAAYLMGAAEICLAHGRPDQAAGFVTRGMESGAQRDPTAWHTYAVALEMRGLHDDAHDAYERAVRLAGPAMFYRAEFAEFALRHQRGLQEAEEIIFETCMGCQATQPAPEQLDAYGLLLTRIQIARGQLKEALQGIERLLAKGCSRVMMELLEQMRADVRGRMAERELDEDRAAGIETEGEIDEH
jgi:tetratricopeptide (TPR) repeat protein